MIVKIASRIALALAAAVGVLALVGSAIADPATRTTFTGADTYVSESAPAAMWFPDGRVHLRGLTVVYSTATTDARVSGIDTVVVNGNFALLPPPVGPTGPMWGTFHIANAGGYWHGNWTGVRDENGFAFIRLAGDGGGGYEGLKVTMELTRLNPNPQGNFTIVGEILDPGGAN